MLPELQDYIAQQGISVSAAVRSAAEKIASEILLAHSTSDRNFIHMCEVGAALMSPATLVDRGVKTRESCNVESVLGTTDYVFFYANAFCFPSTGCGLLFARSLEEEHRDFGSATPFDSGGLVKHFQSPNPSETPRDFFRRHQLPLSEHREYLSQCLGTLFANPFDYVLGLGHCHTGPIGLTGGDDCRRTTHEVRIPEEVAIRSCHLKAVFAPLRLSLEPKVERLLLWCLSEGFDVITFDADRSNDFEKLKTACVDYLRTRLS